MVLRLHQQNRPIAYTADGLYSMQTRLDYCALVSAGGLLCHSSSVVCND